MPALDQCHEQMMRAITRREVERYVGHSDESNLYFLADDQQGVYTVIDVPPAPHQYPTEIVVMARVLGPQGLQDYADMLQNLPPDPVGPEFDDLPADAEEATRQELAERIVPFLRDLFAEHPGVRDVAAAAPGGSRFASETAGQAMRDLYNPAQLDVLRRVGRLLAGDG